MREENPAARSDIMTAPTKPFGLRAALGMIFLSSLSRDFAANSDTVFSDLRKDRPHEYLKLIMSFLPKEALAEKTLGDMTDDEIIDFALEFRSIVRALPGGPARGDSDGEEPKTSGEKTSS
jgi:hypothetical protein